MTLSQPKIFHSFLAFLAGKFYFPDILDEWKNNFSRRRPKKGINVTDKKSLFYHNGNNR
jgi:hypothetical protein